MMTRPRPCQSRILTLLAGLALLASVSAAGAQPGVRTFRGISDTYNTVDLKNLNERFNLDESQKEIVDVLFEDYVKQSREIADELRLALTKLYEESGEEADWEQVMTQSREHQKRAHDRRTSLNEQFIADVRSLLTEQQQAHWPIWERDRYRRLHLPRGVRIGGEGVDLVALVDRMEFANEILEHLNPVLEQYAGAIDAPLREREALTREMREALPTPEGTNSLVMTIGSSPFDPEDEAKVLKQSIAIRDLNDQYLKMLAARLSPADAKSLVDAFNLAAFPRLYRDTRVDDYYQAITANEGLSDPQRAKVDAIYGPFTRDVKTLNDSIADYQRRRESELPEPQELVISEEGFEGGVVMVSASPGEQEEEGTSFIFNSLSPSQLSEEEQRLLDQKKELVQATAERLFALLTPEQQTAHPIPPVRPDGNFQFGQVTLDDGTQLHSIQLGEHAVQVLTEPGQGATVQIGSQGGDGDSEEDPEARRKDDGNEDR